MIPLWKNYSEEIDLNTEKASCKMLLVIYFYFYFF